MLYSYSAKKIQQIQNEKTLRKKSKPYNYIVPSTKYEVQVKGS